MTVTLSKTPRLDRAKQMLAELDTTLAELDSMRPKASLEVYRSERHIYLHGEIGRFDGEVKAEDLIRALKDMPGPVTLFVDSGGGAVDEAASMLNAIEQHGQVQAVILGLAASAAGWLIQGAKRRIALPNSAFMLHSPWGRLTGNAAQIRKDAEVLKLYEERMVEAYTRRSGKSTEVVKALMSAETWYYGRQIADEGFCDELHERFGLVAAKYPRLSKAKAMYSRLLISMMRDDLL